MKRIFFFFLGCLIIAIIISSSLVFAETKGSINVIFDRIKLVVNGESVSKETVLYNGTTYVPLRAVAEILGKEVFFDQSTQTAYIDENGTNRQNSALQAIPKIPHKDKLSADEILKYSSSDYLTAKIPSASMANEIMVGNTLIVDKNAYISNKPKRFDVIMFSRPDFAGNDYFQVKRIIGLPGEALEIKNGLVYINNSSIALNEPYLPDNTEQLNYGPFAIPNNQYFVMGDNRLLSSDSRIWQETYLPFDSISGKVILILTTE